MREHAYNSVRIRGGVTPPRARLWIYSWSRARVHFRHYRKSGTVSRRSLFEAIFQCDCTLTRAIKLALSTPHSRRAGLLPTTNDRFAALFGIPHESRDLVQPRRTISWSQYHLIAPLSTTWGYIIEAIQVHNSPLEWSVLTTHQTINNTQTGEIYSGG